MIGLELEKYSFDYLINSALDNVPDSIDKREGSIIYDALAPACYQLADMYMNLKNVMLNVFVDTSYGEYLDNRVKEQGLERYKATKALLKAEFIFNDQKSSIRIGDRFSSINNEEILSYSVIEKLDNEENTYILECEMYGTIGNDYIGDILPITYIESLKSARIITIVKAARDIETDEELKSRYLFKVRNPVTSGNKYNYLQWALEVDGVGSVKVFPLYNGPGTVKVIVTNSQNKGASKELINGVKKYIDDVRPIGATVSVASAREKVIDINVSITVSEGSNLGGILENFRGLIEEYLNEICFKIPYISIARIGNILLSTPGVIDYSNLKINSSIGNIQLLEDEVAILGNVSLGGD
jgi:uncharacterized phage protein gp47/JayE